MRLDTIDDQLDLGDYRQLWSYLTTLRFAEPGTGVLILGPVGFRLADKVFTWLRAARLTALSAPTAQHRPAHSLRRLHRRRGPSELNRASSATAHNALDATPCQHLPRAIHVTDPSREGALRQFGWEQIGELESFYCPMVHPGMDPSKIAAETNPGFAQRTAEVIGARVWVEGDLFVVERVDRVEKLRCHGVQGSVQDGVAAAASPGPPTETLGIPQHH